MQNNKAKSDLSISIMHMDNSYSGLQQQIASCKAPRIKKTWLHQWILGFPRSVFHPEQRTEQCQVQKTKNEEKAEWTHTERRG